MKGKFSEAGYELPNVIFWNVRSEKPCFHARKNDKGVQLVSGENPVVFKQVIEALEMTPYDAMMQVINSPRYAAVTI
jgi:hypothetical protein